MEEQNTHLVVHIQCCTNCSSHSWCTRHDQHKYQSVFLSIKSAINTHLPDLEVVMNQVPNNYTPLRKQNNDNRFIDTFTKKSVYFPGLGAFEIHFNNILIFSKYESERWPEPMEIVNLLRQVKQQMETVGNLKKYQMFELGQDTLMRFAEEQQNIQKGQNKQRNSQAQILSLAEYQKFRSGSRSKKRQFGSRAYNKIFKHVQEQLEEKEVRNMEELYMDPDIELSHRQQNYDSKQKYKQKQSPRSQSPRDASRKLIFTSHGATAYSGFTQKGGKRTDNNLLNLVNERQTFYTKKSKPNISLTDHYWMYRSNSKKKSHNEAQLRNLQKIRNLKKDINKLTSINNQKLSDLAELSSQMSPAHKHSNTYNEVLMKMPQFIRKKSRNSGQKQMILKLDNIEEEKGNSLEQEHQTSNQQNKKTPYRIMNQWDRELQMLETRFQKFQQKVQIMKQKKKQFEDDSNIQKNLDEIIKGERKPNKLEKQYLMFLKNQDPQQKRKKIVHDYMNISPDERSQKLKRIYGKWKLKQYSKDKKQFSKQRQANGEGYNQNQNQSESGSEEYECSQQKYHPYLTAGNKMKNQQGRKQFDRECESTMGRLYKNSSKSQNKYHHNCHHISDPYFNVKQLKKDENKTIRKNQEEGKHRNYQGAAFRNLNNNNISRSESKGKLKMNYQSQKQPVNHSRISFHNQQSKTANNYYPHKKQQTEEDEVQQSRRSNLNHLPSRHSKNIYKQSSHSRSSIPGSNPKNNQINMKKSQDYKSALKRHSDDNKHHQNDQNPRFYRANNEQPSRYDSQYNLSESGQTIPYSSSKHKKYERDEKNQKQNSQQSSQLKRNLVRKSNDSQSNKPQTHELNSKAHLQKNQKFRHSKNNSVSSTHLNKNIEENKSNSKRTSQALEKSTSNRDRNHQQNKSPRKQHHVQERTTTKSNTGREGIVEKSDRSISRNNSLSQRENSLSSRSVSHQKKTQNKDIHNKTSTQKFSTSSSKSSNFATNKSKTDNNFYKGNKNSLQQKHSDVQQQSYADQMSQDGLNENNSKNEKIKEEQRVYKQKNSTHNQITKQKQYKRSQERQSSNKKEINTGKPQKQSIKSTTQQRVSKNQVNQTVTPQNKAKQMSSSKNKQIKQQKQVSKVSKSEIKKPSTHTNKQNQKLSKTTTVQSEKKNTSVSEKNQNVKISNTKTNQSVEKGLIKQSGQELNEKYQKVPSAEERQSEQQNSRQASSSEQEQDGQHSTKEKQTNPKIHKQKSKTGELNKQKQSKKQGKTQKKKQNKQKSHKLKGDNGLQLKQSENDKVEDQQHSQTEKDSQQDHVQDVQKTSSKDTHDQTQKKTKKQKQTIKKDAKVAKDIKDKKNTKDTETKQSKQSKSKSKASKKINNVDISKKESQNQNINQNLKSQAQQSSDDEQKSEAQSDQQNDIQQNQQNEQNGPKNLENKNGAASKNEIENKSKVDKKNKEKTKSDSKSKKTKLNQEEDVEKMQTSSKQIDGKIQKSEEVCTENNLKNAQEVALKKNKNKPEKTKMKKKLKQENGQGQGQGQGQGKQQQQQQQEQEQEQEQASEQEQKEQKQSKQPAQKIHNQGDNDSDQQVNEDEDQFKQIQTEGVESLPKKSNIKQSKKEKNSNKSNNKKNIDGKNQKKDENENVGNDSVQAKNKQKSEDEDQKHEAGKVHKQQLQNGQKKTSQDKQQQAAILIGQSEMKPSPKQQSVQNPTISKQQELKGDQSINQQNKKQSEDVLKQQKNSESEKEKENQDKNQDKVKNQDKDEEQPKNEGKNTVSCTQNSIQNKPNMDPSKIEDIKKNDEVTNQSQNQQLLDSKKVPEDCLLKQQKTQEQKLKVATQDNSQNLSKQEQLQKSKILQQLQKSQNIINSAEQKLLQLNQKAKEYAGPSNIQRENNGQLMIGSEICEKRQRSKNIQYKEAGVQHCMNDVSSQTNDIINLAPLVDATNKTNNVPIPNSKNLSLENKESKQQQQYEVFVRKLDMKRANILNNIYFQNNEPFKYYPKIASKYENKQFEDKEFLSTTALKGFQMQWQSLRKLYKELPLFPQGKKWDLSTLSIQDKKNSALGTVIKMLVLRNPHLLTRLFQNSVVSKNGLYGLWLCHNSIWTPIVVDDYIPVLRNSTVPAFINITNSIWPFVLEKAISKIQGSYLSYQQLSISDIFRLLTGSNFVTFRIKEDPSMNSKAIKYVSENQNKNFILHCEKYKKQVPTNLLNKIPEILTIQSTQSLDQKDLIQLKIDEGEPFWMKFEIFCQTFKCINLLHLRQNYLFTHLPVSLYPSSYTVVQLQVQGSTSAEVSLCHLGDEDKLPKATRVILYRQQEKSILKLIGQAKEKNKKLIFFDCQLRKGRYFLFLQGQRNYSDAIISYSGQEKAYLRTIETIQNQSMKNKNNQYIPISKQNKTREKQREAPRYINNIFQFAEGGRRSKNYSRDDSNSEKLQRIKNQFLDYLASEK